MEVQHQLINGLQHFGMFSYGTIIFAIISTAAPFFLGLFQAVILNNNVSSVKRFGVVFNLPWALPAMISQFKLPTII